MMIVPAWLAKRDTIKRLISLYLDLKFVLSLPIWETPKVLALLSQSKSQLRQDLFVLSKLSFLEYGYFVEIGAADGCELSNTYLLEKGKHWTGILAEPARCWHIPLELNRPNSNIDRKYVWRTSGASIPFEETSDRKLSTAEAFNVPSDRDSRKNVAAKYHVETISLVDLLRTYAAPQHINYLSIDTEGSEFEILNAFDFSTYSFDVITCEHNYTANRDKIYELLTKHGYKRVNRRVSQFDDWYTRD